MAERTADLRAIAEDVDREVEAKKVNRMRRVIAIDFDGVLCEDEWPRIGAAHPAVLAAALEERRRGAALILWTCRCGAALREAVAWCADRGLQFDAVNENLTERLAVYGTESRKVSADEYWDDRAKTPLMVAARQFARDDRPDAAAVFEAVMAKEDAT